MAEFKKMTKYCGPQLSAVTQEGQNIPRSRGKYLSRHDNLSCYEFKFKFHSNYKSEIITGI
ncbi:hypothetical protein X798_07858, partial [Onchocerca flexuosa]|uniref:Uncharacterized protein n=2 Tax=Onchocerca flexuosa TaxID=387005 RepID=A0A183HC14_9BILA